MLEVRKKAETLRCICRAESKSQKKKIYSRGVFIQVRGETSFVEVIALSRIRRTRDGRLSALARSLSLVPPSPPTLPPADQKEKSDRRAYAAEVLHKLDVSRIFPARRRASGYRFLAIRLHVSDQTRKFIRGETLYLYICTYAKLNNSVISFRWAFNLVLYLCFKNYIIFIFEIYCVL